MPAPAFIFTAATSALKIATERGYNEIVTIIREEERNRQQAKSGVAAPADELFDAIRSGDNECAVARLESDPALSSGHAMRYSTGRQAFATMLLDTSARLDLRDRIFESTPLGWACR